MVHITSVLIMSTTRRKAVVNATAGDLDRVNELVARGVYRSLSEFVREAMAEKLAAIRQEQLAAQVTDYCLESHADEDAELISGQAMAAEPQVSYQPKGKTRAKK